MPRQEQGTLVEEGIYRLTGRSRWRIVVSARDRRGKRRTRERVVEGRLSDARAAREALRDALEADAPAPSSLTLGDYAASWLRRRQHRLTSRTARHYADTMDLHVLPDLGQMRLSAIRAPDIEDLVAAWARAGARPPTINSRLRVLRSCLSTACDELELPDPARKVAPMPEPRGIRRGLTAEELRALLAAARDDERYSLLVCLATTGARWGEATALRWEDFDWARDLVTIQRSHVAGAVRPTTKTGKARVVPMLPALRQALEEWWDLRQTRQGPADGTAWVWPVIGLGGLVRLRTPSSIQKALARWAGAAGIERRVSPQDIRRTVVDLLRTSGADPLVEHSMIGHSEGVRAGYSTVGDEEVRAAAARALARVVGGDR